MKFLPLLQVINEAIPLSETKPFLKEWNKETSKAYFENDPKASHHKYRIYLDLTEIPTAEKLERSVEEQSSLIYRFIRDLLSRYGYKMISYINNKAIDKYNRDTTVVKLLEKILKEYKKKLNDAKNTSKPAGHPSTDIATELHLQDLERDVINLEAYIKEYINDPNRSSAKSFPKVVISRHPYDILGMSTDRGWTSCKNMGTKAIRTAKDQEFGNRGCNRHYLYNEVHSLMVAYLIHEKDKNIQNPIARMNLLPFYNPTGQIAYFLNEYYYGDPGIFLKSFRATVKKWLEEKQKGLKPGEYKISPFVYRDGMYEDQVLMPAKEKLFPWFFKAKLDESAKYEINVEYRNQAILMFKGGIWKDGIWEGAAGRPTAEGKALPVYDLIKSRGYSTFAYWENGTWENGTWAGGVWNNGIWKNGTWKEGDWEKGTWENGTWENGRWHSGTWKSGKWVNGQIYDYVSSSGVSRHDIHEKFAEWQNSGIVTSTKLETI